MEVGSEITSTRIWACCAESCMYGCYGDVQGDVGAKFSGFEDGQESGDFRYWIWSFDTSIRIQTLLGLALG